MSLIKNAQVLSSLNETTLQYFTNLSKILNRPVAELVLESFDAIEPNDYQEWLRVIAEVAAERGDDITNQAVFADLAYEVLENDPKLDGVGASEELTNQIVNTLWHALNTQNHHSQVGNHLQNRSDVEDEETTKKPKVKQSPDAKVMEQIHGSPSLQKVYQGGVSTAQSDSKQEGKPSKSIYTPGSFRDKVWKLGYRHGLSGTSKGK